MSTKDMKDILTRFKEIHKLQSKLRNMLNHLLIDDNDEDFLANTSSTTIRSLPCKTVVDIRNDYEKNRKRLNSKSDTILPMKHDGTKRHPVTNKISSERIEMLLKSKIESKKTSLDSLNHFQGSIRSSSTTSGYSDCAEVSEETQKITKTITNVDSSVQTAKYKKRMKRLKGFIKWNQTKFHASGRQASRRRRVHKALDKLLKRILQHMNYSPEYEGRVVVPYHHPGAKPRLVQIAPRAMNEVTETRRVISSAIKVSVERPLPCWIDRVSNAFRMKLRNYKEAPRDILKNLTDLESRVAKDINSIWQYLNYNNEDASLDLNDDDSSSSICTIGRQYPLRANTSLSISKSRLSLFNFLYKVCPCMCLESVPLRIL